MPLRILNPEVGSSSPPGLDSAQALRDRELLLILSTLTTIVFAVLIVEVVRVIRRLRGELREQDAFEHARQ